jgi:holo-[acyl-carrier protein] synthase
MGPVLVGMGIDLVEIARIKKLHEKAGDTFLNRVFTPRERKFLSQKGNPYPSMAARFAAKEAVFKALDLRGRGASWQDVTVLTLASGRPSLLLSGKTARRARHLGVGKVGLSLSHSKETAMALVYFEKKSPGS